LRAEVTACARYAKGRLAGTDFRNRGTPVAIVVPHAGLAYSGGVAATGYLAVREAFVRVDAFVVFGAVHRFRVAVPGLWARGEWRTPLGDIQVDGEIADALLDAGLCEENEAAHRGDNAIELQTPFIKALFPEAKIVPLAAAFFPGAAGFGANASRVVRETAPGRVVIAVASTDLTHYGASFGVMPAGVGAPALEWTRKNDRRFLDALTGLDLEAIVPIAARDGSACGAGAAAAAAGWARERGAERGTVLAYATSHDIAPSGIAEHFVGYGSVLYASNVDCQKGGSA
jgi:AmmeMemoRadiSam system protein B